MCTVKLKFDKEVLEAEFPKDKLMGILTGTFPHSPTREDERTEILRAIRNPIESPALDMLVKTGQKIVIMASDITRPVPSYKILPELINELNTCGVPDKDITVMFGMGIHRPHSPEEQKALAGEEVYGRVDCIDSTLDGYTHVGTSSAGTPYYINKRVAACDFLIATGNVEYHWFAGYSGGAKAVLPGACNYETIRANHRLLADPNALPGLLDGNPVRADIDEIVRFLPIGFIVNVVLNDKKEILKCFAGHYMEAHRSGCAYLDSVYGKEITNTADVVVVSCGGYPKDINLYQAQKALDNANMAVKDGGTIVLIAGCKDGYGETTFERWINEANSPDEILERIGREFELGGHKASGFAKVLKRVKVIMVTDMEKEKVERMSITHLPKTGLQGLIDDISEDADSILVIPQGGSILPKLRR